jgi:hypothetical protein
MDVLTRQSVLDLLTREWAEYVPRFQRLSPADQASFLEKQGYQKLAGLLAHIVAWWEVGLASIQRFRDDPAARPLEIDVDSFNAQAVEQVRSVTDEDEIRVFEAARSKFVELVQVLSEEEFKDERILNQIMWELVNHLADHRIE